MDMEQNDSKKKLNTDIAPVEIMGDFNVQEDAKFSLRTLQSLSLLAIAVIMFDITSDSQIGSFAISTKDIFAFSIFMFFVILVQYKITWPAYRLYKSYIDNLIVHLNNDIIRIKNVIAGIPKRPDLTEALKASHKKFMEAKLFNYEVARKNSNTLTGVLTFWIARIALTSILWFWITGQSIYASIF